MKWWVVITEGLRFYWAICLRRRLWPSRAYLHWRLGTIYGSFNRDTGAARPLGELFQDLWRDRANAVKFLVWRRKMRRLGGSA